MDITTNSALAICEILVDFDFARVKKTMEAVNWKWELPKILNDDPGDNPGPDIMTERTPTEIEMKRKVFHLLVETINSEEGKYDGGFETQFKWKDESKTSFSVSLQFIPEDIKITTKI